MINLNNSITVITRATCYKCGKKYVAVITKEEELRRVENYDPTDWECEDCIKVERLADEAYVAKAIEEEGFNPLT